MINPRDLLLPILLSVSSPALAQDEHSGPDHNQIQGVRGDVHLNLERYGFFGVGGRLEFALVPDGFLTGNVRDELALSLGADLFFAPVFSGYDNHYPGGAWLIPMALVQWNFYLGQDWSVFPELGLAVHARFEQERWTDGRGHEHGWIYPAVAAGVGARYHFRPHLALLMRVGTPGGLQLGLVF